MALLFYRIPGFAMGAPRQTRADKWKQRPCVLRYRAWADTIRKYCSFVPDAADVGSIQMVAFYKMPDSWSKKKKHEMYGELKRTVPDHDNIFKAAADSLWKNDAALGDVEIRRRWADDDYVELFIEYRDKSAAQVMAVAA